MSYLKPCPFCGGDASFKPRSFKASCDKCGAYVPVGATSSHEAIAAWNRRSTFAAQNEDVEPLLERIKELERQLEFERSLEDKM